MRRVIIESPFAGSERYSERGNVEYARAAVHDCLRRGEAPLASHLLYPQVLDDSDPSERDLGIYAGLAWGDAAEAVVVYTDRGISGGMAQAISRHLSAGRVIEYRKMEAFEGQGE